MKRYLLLVLSVLAISNTSAQSPVTVDPATCQVYAKDSLFDTNGVMSWDYQYASHLDQVCSNTAQSTDTKLNMAASFSGLTSYGPIDVSGLADFGKKKEKLDSYCKHVSSLSVQDKQAIFSSTSFGSAMASVANSCIDVVKSIVTSRGTVFAYATPNNSDLTEFVVTVEPRPNPSASVVTATGIEAANVECTRDGLPLTFPYTLQNYVSNNFLCKKRGASGTFISFNTNSMGSTNWVRIPGAGDMEIVALRTRMDTLQSMISEISNRRIALTGCEFPTGAPYNKTFTGHHLTIQNSWNNFDSPLVADCPNHKVMIGVESDHHNTPEDRGFKFKCCSVEWR